MKMGKNQKFKNGPKELKMKNKLAAKMKDKLKSALFGSNTAAAKGLLAEAKTQKPTPKFNFTKVERSTDSRTKANQHATKNHKFDKNSKVSTTNSKGAKENVNHANASAKIQSNKDKNNTHLKNHHQQSDNQSEKVNGHQNANSLQHQKKKKTKPKNKPKLKQKQKQEPTAAMADKVPDVKSFNKNKRGKDEKQTLKPDTGKKRLKTAAGFVESNANDVKQSKLIEKKLKKTEKNQPKFAKNSEKKKSKHEENAPSIKVHNIDESSSNGSEHHSDSEADSYIDKFFHDGDEDFDENRIYSMDELKTKNENGFLFKASGGVNKSDESSPSEIPLSNKKSEQANGQPKSKKATIISPKNKLLNYNKNEQENESDSNSNSDYDFNSDFDSDDYESMSDEEDESGSDESYIDSDNSDMMYGTDSEESLGSEVIFSDDTYEIDSSDNESMEEYEDDMTHEDDENESVDSHDAYEDFLHQYDDSHSSSDDHEYTGKSKLKYFC